MRTSLLALLAIWLCLPATASAQTYPVDRGVFIVGGSASLASDKVNLGLDESERRTRLSISPDVQYFFIPNLAVGGLASFFYRNFDGESRSDLFLGPKVSYYFGGPGRTLYPFLSGQLAFDVDNFKDTSQLVLEAGGAYMLVKNIALTGAVFFSGPTDNLGDDNTIGLAFGVRAFAF